MPGRIGIDEHIDERPEHEQHDNARDDEQGQAEDVHQTEKAPAPKNSQQVMASPEQITKIGMFAAGNLQEKDRLSRRHVELEDGRRKPKCKQQEEHQPFLIATDGMLLHADLNENRRQQRGPDQEK